MHRLLTVGGLALVLAVASASGVASGRPETIEVRPAVVQETSSSTLDGVFSSAQARWGRRVYNQNCASCHGQELRGGEMGPGIAGSDFMVFWTELPLGSLYDRIRISMPEDGPGRLSDQEYIDVVAYILDANEYPTGDQELVPDMAALDQIMIVAAE